MKKGIVIGGAVMVALGVAGYAVVSSFLSPMVWARDTMRDGGMVYSEFAGGGPAALGEKLHLTQDQRAQIKTIVAGEKPTVAPLVQQLGATFKQVQAITNTGAADPAKVHALIDQEQPALARLIVEGVRTKTTIYNTVLTASQQQKAQDMLADVGPRMEARIGQLPAMADRFVSMASWRLNLSDAQQDQIRSLVNAGVQKDLPLVKQLAQERQALVTATAGGKFDQAQVQQLAQAPATTATQLAGDAAVLKSQVFAVLTPAQRDQVIQFQALRREHRAARFGHRFGGWIG